MRGLVFKNRPSAHPVSAASEAGEQDGWLCINAYSVGGVLGASLCVGWHLSLLLRPDLLYASGGSMEPLHGIMGFVIATFLVYFVMSMGASLMQSHRSVGGTVALVSALVAFFPLGEGVSLTVIKILFAGVGCAVGMSLWVDLLCSQPRLRTRLIFSAVMALGVFWSFGLMLVMAPFSTFVILAYGVISPLCYLILGARFAKAHGFSDHDVKQTDVRNLITWRSCLLTIIGSMAQGFSLAWLLPPVCSDPLLPACVMGGTFLVMVILFMDTLHRFVIREKLIRKLFLPVIVSAFLMVLVLPEPWRFLPMAVAFVFSLLPYATAFFATCEHMVLEELSVFRAFPSMRGYATAGLFFGLAFGGFATTSDMFGDVTLQVWVLVVVVIFIIVFSMLTTKSFYPGDETRSLAEQDPLEGEGVQAAAPGPLAEYNLLLRRRCDSLGVLYGLTERQQEVFFLLARGRNTAFIQEHLVISPHTVKAHVGAIYKKTGLHSQQELIDLVEGEEGLSSLWESASNSDEEV